jgi:hypothetical protein
MPMIADLMFELVRNNLEPFLERLFEGGAFGHLAHPFEDIDMTFGQMKKMVNDILSGRAVAYEKIDGQQISFSWKNGRLIAARNKGQLKNRGETSLTTDTIKGFIGKSGQVPSVVIEAFYRAVSDLETALKRLDPKLLQNMFQEGRFFMNTEIVAEETANVIPYYKDYLVFHGLIEYDTVGNPIGEQLREPGKQLENALRAVKSDEQSKFSLRAANQVALKNFKELPEKRNQFLTALKQLQGKMSDDNTLKQQQEIWWRSFIIDKAKEMGYKISPEVLGMLIGRWARGEKGENSTPKIVSKIDNEQFRSWVVSYDKEEYVKQYDKNLFPYEMFFLKLGAEVLANASGFLTAAPEKTVAALGLYLQKDAQKIKASKDPKDLEKLTHELERLEQIGRDKIVGTEGVVFSMHGNLYKLTGIFAPVNQILGILKFKRPSKEPVKEMPTQPVLPLVESKYNGIYKKLLLKVIFNHSQEPVKGKNAIKKYQLTEGRVHFIGFMACNGKIEKLEPKPVGLTISEFLFGPCVSSSDINTFEKLFKQLDSSNFRYKNKKSDIIESFNENLVRMKLPIVEK